MASYNDVIVRPTEITFPRSPHSARPVEVLVLNRSQKRLRYKILCTARGTYALSKCKGTLCPEAFVKINIELIRTTLPEQNRRDFFKIQFFDCMDDSFQGERFISSIVLPDPVASSYRSLDSDSCNSWPNLSVASSPPRTLSLMRPNENLSTCASHSTMKEDPKALPTTLIRRGEHSSLVKSTLKTRSTADKSDSVSRTSGPVSSTVPTVLGFLTHSLRRIFCLLAFLLCFVGICLPMLSEELAGWSHLIPVYFGIKPFITIHPSQPPDGSCDAQAGGEQGYGHKSPSCSPTQQHRVRNLDEFARHSQLAITSLKTALHSFCGALSALNPVSLIANLSWFCLGLLLMYTLKRR